MDEKKKQLRKNIRSLFWVIIGNMLYALAVKLFLLPTNLVIGGTTGIGLILQNIFGIPISGIVFTFNMCMLILGYYVLGKRFAATTVISSFTYPLALELFNRLLPDVVLTDDVMLCTVFAGIGIGASLGIVLQQGASTGGMDIPPLILNHYWKIPVSVGLYLFDIIIILGQAAYQPTEMVLYGIILELIFTVLLDKMMIRGTSRTEVKVISKKSEEIREAILSEVDRGVTMIYAEGGFSHKKKDMVFTIISNRELPRLERRIHEIDPESFLIISRVSEVKGKGFTLEKEQ